MGKHWQKQRNTSTSSSSDWIFFRQWKGIKPSASMQLKMLDNVTQNNSNCTIDSSVEDIIIPIMYLASLIVGLPGNCLSIYVACLQVNRENEIGVYLLNLSFADVLYTLTIPYWFIEYFDVQANVELYNLINVVTYTTMYLSPAFLCCISMDRYLATVYPLRYFSLRTVKAAIIVSVICWVLQLMCHALLLYQQNFFSMFHFSAVYEDTYPMKSSLVVEYLTRFAIGFCLPLTLLLFCSQRMLNAINDSTATVDTEKRKIVSLLLRLLLVYIISFGPYHVIMLIRSLIEPGNCYFAQKINIFYKVSFALTGLNSAADPIIYCLLCDSARQDIRNLFTAMKMIELKKIECQNLTFGWTDQGDSRPGFTWSEGDNGLVPLSLEN
ncbi:G-protein coupled receptor 4-like [Chiloscyllium punctatum]|uniref:G-protein coupled receptor 4-like n=1 Tax=Chiloscyllium punctatum TaxID=137246 RepID=UPI003B63628D